MAILTVGCSLINEELEPCAPAPHTFTKVNFVYDYNMQYTDLFTDHVGSVYLYVFDKNGTYLDRHTKHRSEMTQEIDFSMTFNEEELEPGETYQLLAIAQGNHVGNSYSNEMPGFQLVNPMIPGVSKIEDYILRLDRKHPDGTSGIGEFEYKDIYGNTQTMIDTLWSTKPDEAQILRIPSNSYIPSLEPQPDNELVVTIPMMRITNSIKVNLVHDSFNSDTDTEAFKFLIHFPRGNGSIGFTGNVLPYEELYYRSLRKELIVYNGDSQISGVEYSLANPYQTRADDSMYSIRAHFGVSRLMTDDESSLQIRDSETDEIVTEITDFSKFLAQAFDDTGMGNQEFLDREYDFEISIGIKEIPSESDSPKNPEQSGDKDPEEDTPVPEQPGVDNPGSDRPDSDQTDPEDFGSDNTDDNDQGDAPGNDNSDDNQQEGDQGDKDLPGEDQPEITDPSDNWDWIEIYIKALGWKKRIYNYTLH
ncbi:MAG: FimB/Mfa2 family fimbrial subunit [Muribaculaceae bacterium]|nr:FimB/Mfa2 family fimbrial subunit [Muribaculaceae bacterium]